LIDNAHNTPVANNTGAVFSVVRATHEANNIRAVFSVIRAATIAIQLAIHEASTIEDGVFLGVRPEAI
jgi:hypothetical protein